jgi:dolichyl-phosphate beta-glucosyltransferase
VGADPSVSLILPAYNEARTIGLTLTEAQEYFARRSLDYEILLVAEGDDGTREIAARIAAQNPRLTVLGGKERRGKGRAIRQAVALAGKEVVGFADADNKTPISELDKVLPRFEDGADVVIGSRALSQSRIERSQRLYRRLGSRAFRLLMHALIGLRHIPDTQCGFKFFRREVAKDLFARQRIDGYMFDVEILYLAQSAGYNIVQVPIRWQDDADSRFQVLGGTLKNARDILRIRLSSRNCAPS